MEDKLLSKKEYNVFKKFIHWNIVTDEDQIILDRYASIGFVRFGFDWDKMEETAKLTESGLYHLNK